MSYEHGISVTEKATTFEQPLESLTVQVAFGTAPINLASDIDAVVNKPVLIRTFEEGKKRLGYSDNWDNYNLSEVMDASFKQIKVAPVIFVNVLDPATHKQSVSAQEVQVENLEVKIDEEGILLNTLVVKDSGGTTTYVEDQDYVADFNTEGKVVISVLTGGTIADATTLTVDFDKLDPTLVTDEDIIGGYDSATDTYTGIETITTVFPKLNRVGSLLLSPGYSQNKTVGAVLVSKSENINGSFKTENVLDVTGDTIDSAIADKDTKLYDDKSSIVCWPKVKISGKTYRMSSIAAAVLQRTDAENGNVPFVSPSNKRVPLESIVNDSGKELYMDQVQGNELNAKGIVTAINFRGWRMWGNNTAAYEFQEGVIPDPKDRFIAVRRMFNWWGNSFILNFFDRVDGPISFRLIESIVDGENIRANGFQAAGQIAGAQIEFRRVDNPESQILDGSIKFVQKIGFLPPAEHIENQLEFDPTILSDSLFGGDE